MPDQPPNDPNRWRLTDEEAARVSSAVRGMIERGEIVPATLSPEPDVSGSIARSPTTADEYLNPAFFPVTTQLGMTLTEQFDADEVALDEIRDFFDGGGERMSPKLRERL